MTDDPSKTDRPEAGDARLDRVIGHLRTLDVPPVPAEAFTLSVKPVRADERRHGDGPRGRRSARPTTFAWAGALGGAALVLVGGVVVLNWPTRRLPDRVPIVRDTPTGTPPSGLAVAPTAPPVAVAAVPPHPGLTTLAARTAALRERVGKLRRQAEATAARRQAERLLQAYAGR